MFVIHFAETGTTIRAEAETLDGAVGFIKDFRQFDGWSAIGLWKWQDSRWFVDVYNWVELWEPPAPVHARIVAPLGFTPPGPAIVALPGFTSPGPNHALQRTEAGGQPIYQLLA